MGTLSGFVNIGPRISFFTPSKPVPGQLVIICTWLRAAHKHISKYISLYQKTAPGSRILLVESNVPILISSYVHQRHVIGSAISVVLDTLSECGFKSVASTGEETERIQKEPTVLMNASAPKIILHTFSNGGTNTATQLLLVLNARLRCPLPLVGLLCDSCPAKGTYWKIL